MSSLLPIEKTSLSPTLIFYEPYIEENTRRYKVSKELYRERQALVEHQFGTIKRQWGFDHTLLKTTQKVEGEFAMIFTCYNLRRAISILGAKELIQRIKKGIHAFSLQIKALLRLFKNFFSYLIKMFALEILDFSSLYPYLFANKRILRTNS